LRAHFVAEFARIPVGRWRGDSTPDGRGHWHNTGFAFISGGGLRMGQVVGASDRRGENPVGRPFRTQNVLATLYNVLGIDPATTFPDHNGRPLFLLKQTGPIAELI
jgi:hypothetical protein